MRLKEGYTETEFGVIPNEWETKSLEDVCLSSGLVRGPFGGSLKKDCFVDNGYKVYEQRNAIYNDIGIGNYYINDSKYIELKRFAVKNGDYIVSCSGTIGKIFQIPDVFEPGIINQALLKITLNKKLIHDLYFLQYFRWEKFQNRITDNTQGGAMKNLVGMSEFKKTQIPIPTTMEEQIAIAAALSDMDALISSLEKLIEKKRAIKQGAMQELLRPKEGWVVRELGEICSFYNGKAHENYIDDNGDYAVVNSKFISTNGQIVKYSSINLFPLEKNDITMVMSDIPNGKALAKCFIIPEANKYALNQRICAIRSSEVDINFLALMMNRNKYYLAFDSGSGQTNLRKNEVLECLIPLPPTTEEQRYISSVICDIEYEIKSLEKILLKYIWLKQGMAQELLTGKTRLI